MTVLYDRPKCFDMFSLDIVSAAYYQVFFSYEVFFKLHSSLDVWLFIVLP